MSFFNTKEEVIDIELTPYGKMLLSKGKWKPAYYEFYDDDIIYDSQYAGYVEGQEKTQQRIKDTPRKKVQYTFEGADIRYKEYLKQLREAGDRNIDSSNTKKLLQALNATLEKRKNFSLSSLPLANSKINSEKNPAWNIKVLNGEISSSASSVSVTGLPNNLNIINLKDCYYKISPKELQNSTTNQISEIVFDNFYVDIEKDFLLLHIKEQNTDLLKENFDFFIYEIEETENGEIEKPLYFKKQNTKIVNNILLDEDEEQTLETSYQDVTYANHYFSISFDKEISNALLGEYLTQKERQILTIKDGYKFVEVSQRAIRPVGNLPPVPDETDFEDC